MVAVRAPHRRSRLRISGWRVRTKLGVVLLIPSLAVLALAGVQVGALVGEAGALADYAGQLGLARQVGAAVHELQGERDRTIGELAARESDPDRGVPSAALRGQRAATDAAVRELREAGTLVVGDRSWQEAYENALRELGGLGTAREKIGSGSLPRRAAHDVYSRAVGSLLALLSAPDPGPEHVTLDRSRAGLVELARAKELTSQLRARVYAVGTAGGFAPGDYVDIADLRAQRLAALVRFRGTAPGFQVERYETTVTERAINAVDRIEQSVVDSAGTADVDADPRAWWAAAGEHLDQLRDVEAGLIAEAAATAGARSDRHWAETWLVIALIGGAMLAALLISLLVGRSMARSLRVLRHEALRVAQVELPRVLDRLADARGRLPEIELRPPDVPAADEIGEVADAFAAVHASAVSLAVEQAAMRRNVNTMFVNLARRSQVLVERQLELLDELERAQQDPDLLDGLFRLDHLAARMRRNDESLLVLAGNENARRWSAPIAVSAAMLAAIAEIEQYPRVRHAADDTWHIVGHAAADLIHLLAELLENATAFSPPDTEVYVVGAVVGGRLLIEVRDAGLGMSPGAVEAANELLERPPAADVAASERMGLFVVSHLAARHGVRVRLRAAERGVVASVWLPPELLAPAPVGEHAPYTAPGQIGGGPRRPATAPPTALPARPAGLPPLPPVTLSFTGRQARAQVNGASTWWSRTGTSAPAAGGGVPGPPEAPVTAGVNARGLPVRVPMAQLPADAGPPSAAAGPDAAASYDGLDPDAVGSTLARFHSGVRRAEAEQ